MSASAISSQLVALVASLLIFFEVDEAVFGLDASSLSSDRPRDFWPLLAPRDFASASKPINLLDFDVLGEGKSSAVYGWDDGFIVRSKKLNGTTNWYVGTALSIKLCNERSTRAMNHAKPSVVLQFCESWLTDLVSWPNLRISAYFISGELRPDNRSSN